MLTVCKNGGGRLSSFHRVNDVNVSLQPDRREEKAFMHIFILNKKLVFCFTKAQNSSLEQILQEWLHACSTLLPLTIYLGKL